MKKTILLGCLASLLTTPVLATETVHATETPKETVIQATQNIKKPTTDDIKKSFVSFITKQTQLGQLFDLDQMTVSAQGNDFILSLPTTQTSGPIEATEQKTISYSEKKIPLTYADGFNGHAQYRIDSVFETMQALIKEIIPEASLTTEQSNAEILWVPYYNLISKNTQNIKNLKLELPEVLDLSVGSVISDSLARPINGDRMDRADIQDVKDITIASEGITLSVPHFSFEDEIQNGLLSPLNIQQITSSDKASFKLTIPTIVAVEQGTSQPLGSLAFGVGGQYQDNTLHLEATFENITLNKTLLPLPPIFLPTEISLNADIKNLNEELLNTIFDESDTITQEQRQKALRDLTSTLLIQLNKLEVKNAEAGISVSGTLQNNKLAMGLVLPTAHLTAVITNLDKISPEPKTDTVQCEQVKKQMETLTDRAVAEKAIQNACAPRGGFLDDWRVYLNPEKRTVAPDGTTTDTLTIVQENGVLTINGKEVK